MSTASQRFGWCLYDFANSAYPTVIVTFLFGAWFRAALAPSEAAGDASWAWAMALSGLIVAVVSPVMGHLADHRGRTYRYLVLGSAVVIGGTAGLAFAERDPTLGHGSPATVFWVLAAVVATNAVFEMAFVFYNAFLPRLVGAEGAGRLSGNGWAFGYVGGLACLGICFALVPGAGAPDAEIDAAIRTSCLVVAGWFLVFGAPALWALRGVPVGVAATARVGLGASLRGVGQTLRQLPQHPDLLRLLIARLIYNDAVIALITLAALYMNGTLGMSFNHILLVGIALNVAAGAGAFVFGFLDDRRGARWTIAVSLLMLIAGAALALLVPTVEAFYVAAGLIGIALGPNQAASRSMLGRFVPATRSTEFYGLFALSGKATVWLGPALFGWIVAATGDQRLALSPLVGMFVIGLVLLLTVDEARGVAHAAEVDRA